MSRVEHRSPWTILKDITTGPSRLRARWRRRRELGTVDRRELEQIAGDLGMTGAELLDLAARGPHAADELRERMRIMGLTRADAEQTAYGLMRDLERTCAHCREKGRCGKDLARRPGDPVWSSYCPNAVSLSSVSNATRDAPSPGVD